MPVTINGNGTLSGVVIGTTDLADASVTTAKIATGAVATADISDGAVTTVKIADANVTVAKISATGTPSSTTFLRGDGSWQTAGGAPGAYDVGAYIVAHKNTAGSSATTAGETISGGSLRVITNNSYDMPIASGATNNNWRTPGFSGTWRAMQAVGSGTQIDGTSANVFSKLWCRVS